MYVLENRATGLLKIGISVDPEFRAMVVSRDFGCDAVVLGIQQADAAARTERFLHGMLADRRVVGEWFEVPERQRGYLLAYFTDQPAPAPSVPRPKAAPDPQSLTTLKEQLADALRAILDEDSRSDADIARDLGLTRQRLNQLKVGDRTAAPTAIYDVLGALGYGVTITVARTTS